MSAWWLFPNTVTVSLLNSITVFIALIHNLCLLVFVCYRSKIHGKELSDTHSLQNPLHIATYLTYFGFLFYNISAILISVQNIYESLTCTYSLYVVLIAYSTSRYFVWLFSLIRIRVVFHIELLQWLGYKKKTLIIFFMILTICFIQNMTILFITTSGMEVYIDGGNSSFCAYVINYMSLVIYMQLIDQLCMIGCFLLFFKKMRWINKFRKSLGDDSESFELKYILTKYTILLATNLSSSWFLMLFVTFTPLGTMAAQIDSVINMWTIILFDARYDKIYKKIFGFIAIPKQLNVNTVKIRPVTVKKNQVTKPNLKPVFSLSLVKNDSVKICDLSERQKPRLNVANSVPIQVQYQ